MKFKKILTLVLTMILALALVGCGNQNTESAVAVNLEKSTDRLMNVVSTLENVEYKDIVIDDFSPLTDNYSEVNSLRQIRDVENNYSANRVLQKTKTYELGSKKLVENAQNTKSVNNSSMPVLSSAKPKQSPNAQFVSGNKIEVTDNSKSWSPKYVNNVSENFSREHLDSYLKNIEGLYNCCADCLSCDAECKSEQAKLEQNIKDAKTYCPKLKDGTIKLTEQEILKCNQCLNDLNSCIARLKSTRGNIYSKATEISRLKNTYVGKVSTLHNLYEKLDVALETRLDCLKCCNDNICQIYDIINKSNVDIEKAEQNKSNFDEIIKNENRLNEENKYRDDIYENSVEQNITPEINVPKTNKKSELTNKNLTDTNNKKDLNNTQNQSNKKNNQIDLTTYNTYKNENQKTILERAKNQNKNQISNYQTKNDNVENNKTNNNNMNNVENNNTNQNTLNQPVQNSAYGYDYPYPNGYGYNGPYNYGPYQQPYPPRNIDTYRTIQKNIDTYAPNYQPVPNNQNANQNSNYNNQNDNVNNNTIENNKHIEHSNNQNSTAPILKTKTNQKINENKTNQNNQSTQNLSNKQKVDKTDTKKYNISTTENKVQKRLEKPEMVDNQSPNNKNVSVKSINENAPIVNPFDDEKLKQREENKEGFLGESTEKKFVEMPVVRREQH